jgi:CNT family concentrative nucleoside transporter
VGAPPPSAALEPLMLATFVPHETTIVERLISLGGIPILVLLAWLMSADRKKISWKPVIWGVALQLLFGAAVLSPALSEFFFTVVDKGVKWLIGFAEEGASFVFGTIDAHQVLDMNGQPRAVPFGVSPPVRTFAFWILPTVVFFSALMALLYHYGLMQWLVKLFARLMQRTMGTSGAESLSAAANIFVGQTEAPLVIRPFVETMTRSELNAVMVGGFATIAGGVMAIYVGVLGHIPGIAGHLVTASIMSAPAALAIAKLMVPETGTPKTMGKTELSLERLDVNGIDALSRGTLEGLTLALNIGAMLLVFVAVIAMFNAILGFLGSLVGLTLSLQVVFGWLFAPMAMLMGIPCDEARTVGMLLGEKLVLTELIAFLHLGELQSTAQALSPRSAVITSYALCGFANFASIGIQIGGIGGIAPSRRHDLAELGLRAMVAGSLACFMTGCVAGVLIG